jgi:hypothetical protein
MLQRQAIHVVLCTLQRTAAGGAGWPAVVKHMQETKMFFVWGW